MFLSYISFVLQAAERQFNESQQRLRTAQDKLKNVSEQLADKQKTFDEHSRKQTELNGRIDERKSNLERIAAQSNDTHNDWTSKRAWVSDAASHLSTLTGEIDSIRERNVAEIQNNTNRARHRSNDYLITPSRIQQQLLRK